MTPAPLILLAPYGPGLWRDMLARFDHPAGIKMDDLSEGDSLPRMAERLLAAAPPRFALAGFCMGGYLAFEICRQARERVARLALINSGPLPDSTGQAKMRADRIAKLNQKAAQMAFPDPAYIDQATQWLLAPASYESPDIVRRTRDLLGEIPLSVSAGQQQAMLDRPDSRDLLPHIQVPTLIVGGSEDRVVPARQLSDMAKAVPGAQLHVLDKIGHLAPIEAPKDVAELMTGWLGADPDRQV